MFKLPFANVLMLHKERDGNRCYGLQVVEIACKGQADNRIGVIKDISSTGARIRLQTPSELTRKVRLTSPSIGDNVGALIRWRNDTEIGVRFDRPLQ